MEKSDSTSSKKYKGTKTTTPKICGINPNSNRCRRPPVGLGAPHDKCRLNDETNYCKYKTSPSRLSQKVAKKLRESKGQFTMNPMYKSYERRDDTTTHGKSTNSSLVNTTSMKTNSSKAQSKTKSEKPSTSSRSTAIQRRQSTRIRRKPDRYTS